MVVNSYAVMNIPFIGLGYSSYLAAYNFSAEHNFLPLTMRKLFLKTPVPPQIGIFWVYKNQVIGKTCALGAGQENVPGLIDSPDSHVELWEHNPDFVIPFPELEDSDYQDVPRGRVIYSTKAKKVIVYMDKVLHTKGLRQIIAKFFQLNDSRVDWKIDDHYTTLLSEIDDLFGVNPDI